MNNLVFSRILLAASVSVLIAGTVVPAKGQTPAAHSQEKAILRKAKQLIAAEPEELNT